MYVFALSLALIVGVSAPQGALSQTKEITDPNDPLVKFTNEFIDHSFAHGSKDIERFIFAEKVKDDEAAKVAEAKRVTAIGRFADGFVFITKAKLEEPESPWAKLERSHFAVLRPLDETGKPKDEIVVRFKPPTGFPPLVSRLDKQPYNCVEWRLLLRYKDSRPLINSVTQHFLNVSLPNSGREITLQ